MKLRPKQILILVGLLVFIPLAVYVVVGTVFSIRARSLPNQALFSKGEFPDPLPDGDMQGHAIYQASWLGKSFTAKDNRGINRFNENGRTAKHIPFITYKGYGVNDPELEVLKIDYNIPGNPIYLRFILDEIVEVAPGQYLGKLHVRIIPFLPFTIEYFTLNS